ncbi:MAG: HEAT repeat domain-containing protein [Myxococcota bacterium]
MISYDERDRESVLRDLESPDDEVRRLAVERIEALSLEEAIQCLLDRLGDSDWRVRKAAVGRIVAQRDQDRVVRGLVDALSDGDNSGRRNAAVEALIALGSRAIPALVEASTIDDADVRKFVVDTLAGIGDADAMGAIMARLMDEDTNVRAAAADALGAIGGPAACSALRETATDGSQEALVRFSALHALDGLEAPLLADELSSLLADPLLGPPSLALLGRAEDDPGAEDALLKGLSSGRRSAREAAMRGLVRVAARHDASGVSPVVRRIRTIADASPEMVLETVSRLGETDLGTQLGLIQFLGLAARRESVVPILAACAEEALAQVAVATLASMGTEAEDEISAAWGYLDAERRQDACRVFGRTGGPAAMTCLIDALEDTSAPVRTEAARALGGLGFEEALAPLVRRLPLCEDDADLDEGERGAIAAAIISLAETNEDIAPQAIERLGMLWEGAEAETRLAVASVFAHIASPADAQWVSVLLKDPDEGVRHAAVEAIPRLQADGVPEALRLALADESATVRVAAAETLGHCAGDEVLDDLQRLVLDEDPRVRATAIRAIGARFASDPSPAVRALALGALHRATEDDALVALAVIEAVGEIGGEVVAYVAPLLNRAEPDVVREAVRCLGRRGEPDQLMSILPLVGHRDWSVRAEVIEVLALHRVQRAVPAILRRLETEQDDFVRATILSALERLES